MTGEHNGVAGLLATGLLEKATFECHDQVTHITVTTNSVRAEERSAARYLHHDLHTAANNITE